MLFSKITDTESAYLMLLSKAKSNFDFEGNDNEPDMFFKLISMVLDEELKIEFIDFSARLFFGTDVGTGNPFSSLLAPESKPLWDAIEKLVVSDRKYHSSFQLTFRGEGTLLAPSFCWISKIYPSGKVLVNSLLLKMPLDYKNTRYSQRHIAVRKVYDYIQSHLEEPLPTVSMLSLMSGMSATVLKTSYQQFFKTSIHKSYNEARLQRAYQLLCESDIQMKAVASSCGFQTQSYFSKAFKKRFGMLPSEALRKVRQQ